MEPRSSARLEKLLVILLASSFVLPGLAGVFLRGTQTDPLRTAWLRNATLSGVQVKPPPVPFNAETLRTAKFQGAHARDYDTDFAGRELLIRLGNELYFRCLGTASPPVIVGPGPNLIEDFYADEYCLKRAGEDALRPFAENLRRLQDFCTARGIAFALVLTPSKASIMPETLPASWRRRYRPGARYYDRLVALLREKGIRYVDGHLITAGLKPTAPAPIFPAGGVHWGAPAALATTNALLAMLAAQGLPVVPIRDYETRLTLDPQGQDKDMADLINTASQLRYPVAEITVKPVTPVREHRPTLVAVGGSFTEKIMPMLGASRQFSETDFYFYYRQFKQCQGDGDICRVAESAPPPDFDTEVFAADCLVLELNEQVMPTPGHLEGFLKDALAALPDPHAVRMPFHYETHFDYQWGDRLSFEEGKCPVRILATSGLSPALEGGAYTEKPLMSIRLSTTPAHSDMMLEVNGHPFLVGGRLLRQRAEVSVNGHPVGEMSWNQPKHEARTLRIPQAFLDRDETVLEFHMRDAAAPASFKIGLDVRELGIRLATLRMSPADGSEAGPGASGPQSAAPYQWGKTFFLTDNPSAPIDSLTGFTPPGKEGSYTEGLQAVLRLATSPAPQDMVLEVDAAPLLARPRLTRQTVNVYVNQHPVGHWLWTEGGRTTRSQTIPKGFLDGNETRVEFRIERPSSPEELGVAKDGRKLGICVASVRFHPVGSR